MQISLKRLSSARKDVHIVVLFEQEKDLPSGLFSKTEWAWVRSELKAERRFLSVNQYNRTIFLQQISLNGKPEYKNKEAARKLGNSILSSLQGIRASEICLQSTLDHNLTLAWCEGLLLGSYQFLKYRSKAKTEAGKLRTLWVDAKGLSDQALQRLSVLAEAVSNARDLVNEPQSFLDSVELAKQFTRMGREAGFKVQVLQKSRIKQLRMGGLLAVNQGSVVPPTFTIMEWKPRNAVNKKPYVLVGKGVVYDTGGMSLKPTPNSMDYMKCDMAGSATVAGTLYALAKAKVPVHVIGLVPATDNRPDGNAYVPGDVITMMSGKTVEVLNTDAEGRLILADALHYAKRYKPELVMEFSTLTGAAAAAIGPYGIVCMGEVDEDTRKALHRSGEEVYERLAEFPYWDDYDELIKSDIADIKNVGGPLAGAITAGRFLAQFTDYPYMHFDIAAPAFSKSNDSYRGKNGTGTGVRLMFDYFRRVAGGE
jgi:leucyl aminopeptidase